ncbi:MAG TPA: glycine--tRNA ligase subunit beta [Deferrisomatales bacterium]|nr:glycine--tRNA ligase subunit beta [Deferrisomatales bacterium]
MAADLILEVGTEEIPAGFLAPALQQLEQLARAGLAENRLGCGALRALGTPRRLVLVAEAVADSQPDAVEEKVGPSLQAAFDRDGNPTRAAQGFARSNGVEVADLLQVETEKGTYVAVKKQILGRPAAEVLAELLPAWVARLHFRKTMRWGSGDVAFARPVHWILALYGGEVVPFAFAGIDSGRTSRGHRFHAPEPFQVQDAADYLRKIEQARVVVDPAVRRKRIAAGVAEAARAVGGAALLDEDLLDTVTNLVELPVPVAGSFEEKYLELPRELLILTMKSHQKYFAVEDDQGRLLNHFVTVSNTAARDLAVVARGNERVLRARLSDARFFFDEDQKTSLEAHAEGLKKVVFQSKLGTSWEKVERFRSLAAQLAAELCPASASTVDRIAQLAKADLETLMVYEFPEIQGIVGREYAARAGEEPLVARGIEQHYWPTQAGGELPRDAESDCVSLADKLDTIVGCFGVGLIPTGTADPYALRRQTLGVLRILDEKGYRLGLGWLVDGALGQLGAKLTRPAEAVKADVLAFFRGRLEGLLAQGGLAADLVQGVLDAGCDDVVDARARAQALAATRAAGELAPLAETFKRVANILKGQEPGAVRPELLGEPAEQDLWQTYQGVHGAMGAAASRGAYGEFLSEAGKLKAAVDGFFEAVMVMAEDPAVRDNRLALLGTVARLFRGVAEFTRIAGAG